MKIEQVWPEWEVEKAIGQGSYGTVYKCVNKIGPTPAYSAIKVISVPNIDSELISTNTDGMTDRQAKEYYREIVDDFENEIKLLESLKGTKNIVDIEDSKVIEKEDGIGWQIFIRMELLTDFNTYISRNQFGEAEAVKFAIDLCEALQVCSKQNIIHRDIKPENIFVDENGDFKLGDFGVAKQLERTEASLSRKGTYNYMAPEVFNSRKYDSRADIYSLGLVIYKILNNNRLPFIDPEKQIIKYSEREEAFEKRIKGEKIPPLKNVDESLNNVILRACAYKLDERFNNIDEFKKALKEIQSGKEIRFNRFKHWFRSHKAKAAVAAALTVAVIATGVVAYVMNRNSQMTAPKPQKIDSIMTMQSTQTPSVSYKIEYSGMCDGLYTYDGVDYVAGYNGNFYAITAKEKKKLTEQQVTTEFTIINDKIYYTVVDNIDKNYDGVIDLMWAQCSCWVMDLDGSNKSKVFEYNGSGAVIFADENSVFYCEDPDKETRVYRHTTARLFKKYDISSKKSSMIYYYGSSSADEILVNNMGICFYYYSGYIVWQADCFHSVESKACIYNIKTDESEQLNFTISMFKKSFFDVTKGIIYFCDNLQTNSMALMEYSIPNEESKVIVNESDVDIISYSEDKIVYGIKNTTEETYNGDCSYNLYTYNVGEKRNLFKIIEKSYGFNSTIDNIKLIDDNHLLYAEIGEFDVDNPQSSFKLTYHSKDNQIVLVRQIAGTFANSSIGENVILIFESKSNAQNIISSVYVENIPSFDKKEEIRINLPDYQYVAENTVISYFKFLGLIVKTVDEWCDNAKEGMVFFSDNIADNGAYKVGDEITVYISKGPKPVNFKISFWSPIFDNDEEYFKSHNVTAYLGENEILNVAYDNFRPFEEKINEFDVTLERYNECENGVIQNEYFVINGENYDVNEKVSVYIDGELYDGVVYTDY